MTPRTDTGPRTDGGDPCEGITQCATAGTSCTGDTLVTCAPNADGCRIETRVDCVAPMVCDDSGATAMCATPDVCTGVPIEDRCDTAGRTCDANTLQVCEANAAGCLVQTDTDCAAAPGGVCGDDMGMSACLVPVDPCADIPMAERCDTAGTSCSSDDLVTCAPNAFGCLVTTTTDCTARAGGACDDTGAAAVCTATDPCAGVTTCAAAGAMCSAGALVTCAPDSFGCLVETSTDCTTAMFGFCDMDASGGPTCATGATDPCMGMTTCDTAGRTCDMDTLNVCAPNALGCLVNTATDCTTDMDICSDAGGMAACVDPCSLVDVCPSATYCDGADVVTCAADANGCLVEDMRTSCTGTESCSDAGGTPMCADTCPEAAPTVLGCGSGTVMGNTMMGSMAISAYPGCSTFSYPNMEQLHRFVNTTASTQAVTINSVRGAGSTRDYDLYVIDGGDGSTACTSSVTCIDGSVLSGGDEEISWAALPGHVYYVVYDLFGTGAAETIDYTLTVACEPVVCGDGVISIGETCDDMGTAPGDGCSATCQVEPLHACTGEPSVCTATCGNGTVQSSAGETCDDGGMAAGDGCSPTCGVEDGYRCSGAPSVCSLLPYTFTTIPVACIDTAGGTEILSGAADDTLVAEAALPFGLPFFGESATRYRVSTNGFLVVASAAGTLGSSSAFSNLAIPATGGNNGIIAPFWDDLILRTAAPAGSMRTLVSGTAPNQVFVVEWLQTSIVGTTDARVRMQAHLVETTGVIEFHYCSETGGVAPRISGSSATIGLESPDGMDGTPISFDRAGAVTWGTTAYRLTPRP